MTTNAKKLERVRVASASYNPDGNAVTFSGLTKEEAALLIGLAAGTQWIRVWHGRVEALPVYQQPPDPVQDPILPNGWQGGGAKFHLDPGPARLDIRHFCAKPALCPSIVIQHLCGYGYTPERYKKIAVDLVRWGFDCCRSRRGQNGRFWEIWYLPSLWTAQAELKEAMGDLSGNTEVSLDKAIRFLCRTIAFGTLDVNVQRAAMTMDD